MEECIQDYWFLEFLYHLRRNKSTVRAILTVFMYDVIALMKSLKKGTEKKST